MIDAIHWLGHSGFRIDGKQTVYIDPWKITGGKRADLILITHDHYDHFSPQDILKIKKDDTVIVAPQACASAIQPVRVISAPDSLIAAGLRVEATFAYNVNKHFHPKGGDGVGYLIDFDGITVYHAGDTDLIPEMKDIRCDIALLPVSGKFVMNAEEAAAAVDDLHCLFAIPMHWGDIIGSYSDAENFQRLAGCEVRILTKEIN